MAYIDTFLDEVVAWAEARTDVLSVALVGSYARGRATEESDIDLVIVAEKPARLLADTRWADTFGHVVRHRLEEHGRVTSLRITYRQGPEVEFALADATWAAVPLDEGTERVIADGMRILYERARLLGSLTGTPPIASAPAESELPVMTAAVEGPAANPAADAREDVEAAEAEAAAAETAQVVEPTEAPEEDRPETLDDRVRRVIAERIDIVEYDPDWPSSFEQEKRRLLACLPGDLIGRIEHVGSTAVPGLAAKPIVDMLVEVADLEDAKQRIVPVLEARGYEYFWRPTFGDDGPPWYAWFIRRDPATGERTHHIHMVEPDFSEHWDWLLFRDYLIEHPDVARDYAALKRELAGAYANDRVRYTEEKSAFIGAVTEMAAHERTAETTARPAWADAEETP